jgi:hypothetical protein
MHFLWQPTEANFHVFKHVNTSSFLSKISEFFNSHHKPNSGAYNLLYNLYYWSDWQYITAQAR